MVSQTMRRFVLLAAMLGVYLPVSARAATPAHFQSLGDRPGDWNQTYVTAVSADGKVVIGYTRSTDGKQYEAFRWSDGAWTGLGDLAGGAFDSKAYGVSADGSVIVGVGTADGRAEAFRWANGAITGLGLLAAGDNASAAFGVSADGSLVVGSSGGALHETEACLWANGAVFGLGYLPGGTHSQALGITGNGATIVGGGNPPAQGAACYWLGGIPTRLGDDSVASLARAVSADGATIVGEYNYSACFWKSGVLHQLGELPGGVGRGGTAFAVTADGATVVGAADAGSTDPLYWTAFIWDETHGLRNLETVLASDYGIDLSAWHLFEANGIAADGSVIAGTGSHSGKTEGWIVWFGAAPTYTLTVTISGQGTVQRAPSTATYAPGTNVALTGKPAAGWHFVRWGGAASGSKASVQVTMDANKSVTAVFAQDQTTPADTGTGDGSGTSTDTGEPGSATSGAPCALVPAAASVCLTALWLGRRRRSNPR
jgi:probable HAF family extracellular repeat protein